MVEEGLPQELLARGGRYAELWARQASLEDVAVPDAPMAAGDALPDGEEKEQVRYVRNWVGFRTGLLWQSLWQESVALAAPQHTASCT